MSYFLSLGVILGLSAGFSPGPLLTLVISETLKYNVRAGIKVALAPLITDLPIILVSFFLLSQIEEFNTVLGIFSILGGLFVFYLGYQNIITKPLEIKIKEESSKSLSKGILTNFLSPHPYFFWLTVGIPIIHKASKVNALSAFIFVLIFYVLLIGSKLLLAIVVGRSKNFLKGALYLNTMRLLGLLLCGLAVALFYDGFIRLTSM